MRRRHIHLFPATTLTAAATVTYVSHDRAWIFFAVAAAGSVVAWLASGTAKHPN